MATRLPHGAYEQLVTELLERRLAATDAAHLLRDLDPAEAALRLSQHLAGPIQRYLETVPAKGRPAAQVELANRLLAGLADRLGDAADERLAQSRVLRAIHPHLLEGQTPPVLPDVPLLDHDLLANAPGEPSFVHALLTELPSADRVDAIVAFIRWSGLTLLREALRGLRARGVQVRFLTTTYIGATERRALDWLDEHGVEVKVSYDTRTTRLHAKAWLLHRESGFSTAFVGSSNLSHSALVSGMEWNLRLAEKTAPAVVGKLRGTFDTLWAGDSGFEPYDRTRDAERFDHAIGGAQHVGRVTVLSGLEVKPWAYQREMLEALVVERVRFTRTRNLIVAPTGTGKTVVAALDFAALRAGRGGVALPDSPRVLFVAHRRRILEQARAVFRNVLRRGEFGELLVGGERPREWDAVFASIQTLSSGSLSFPPDRFDVVYIDEFHHAEARTYQELLERLRPKVLVGLTATPERTDGTNVRSFFGDRYAFEMRLWDALDQQLLAPFHYFGVSDGTDLRRLQWSRGGYRERDLEATYIVDGHDARTAKVIEAIRDVVAQPGAMRALGFCVSVKHAHYMARRFTEAGLRAVAMDGDTSSAERDRQLEELENGTLQVIFAVDVLTEGVDLPSVDTLLLLRPTESATVFLQQLGRGLRLHRSKSVCTVLDFIGQQHTRFRFDLRLRAMTGRSRAELESDVTQRFPYLPSGCHVHLDRQAEEHILENLKESIGAGKRALVRELTLLHQQRGELTLHEFLEHSATELDDVYRRCSWTELKRAADLGVPSSGPREKELLKGLRRLREVDDTERLDVLFDLGTQGFTPGADLRADRVASMLAFVLFDDGQAPTTLPAVVEALAQEPAVRRELAELAEALTERADHITRPSALPPDIPLHLHGHYRREEILVALGERELGGTTSHREGLRWVADRNIDAFFVTLEKSERHYSPSTRYHDYAVSRELFHWESQSGTTRSSPTGQRYLSGSSTVLLFVRKTNKRGAYAPGFVFLGPARLVDARGEQPIAITWKLDTPMPERWFRLAKAVAG
jgi:superfamily II DNA or RNA helicase/HKD family nuclease